MLLVMILVANHLIYAKSSLWMYLKWSRFWCHVWYVDLWDRLLSGHYKVIMTEKTWIFYIWVLFYRLITVKIRRHHYHTLRSTVVKTLLGDLAFLNWNYTCSGPELFVGVNLRIIFVLSSKPTACSKEGRLFVK